MSAGPGSGLCDLTITAAGGVSDVTDGASHRAETFDHRWTGRKDKDTLARAGFIYTGIGDKVECERCGLKLLNWTDTDDALHEHATRRTHCPFIVSLYRKLGQTPPPKHPQYQHLRARLDSFADWPRRYVPKTPEELAAAGFFYIGSADRVTCFQCGITLRDWEEEHDPVAEHQRYSEHCQFIDKTDLNQLGVATRINSTPTNEQSNHHAGSRNDLVASSPLDQGHVSPMVTSCHTLDVCSSTTSNLLSAASESVIEAPSNVSCSKDLQASQPGREGSLVTPTSQRLVVENKRLRENSTCRLCRNEAVGVLFLPCGHLVTCSTCAPTITDCIICGKTILGTVKTFFS
ncbi:putative inhibitor of apoptosis [Haliotis rufescens]|uniref:putative inhibitor of apoptosis n=1 Tax=Haliotis rufescens TaxID=6454 RepID=UPI00201F8647|nr:putative inhibitor of apoptosis [Haliotis rufescens]